MIRDLERDKRMIASANVSTDISLRLPRLNGPMHSSPEATVFTIPSIGSVTWQNDRVWLPSRQPLVVRV
jgi:hypothetical protein